ncbi:MAG TPA: hypothetical protein VKP66_05525 [Steroidobacteraceae bacterium]|nr:hypothetical protein [Steroidobacteraceae bacterium]
MAAATAAAIASIIAILGMPPETQAPLEGVGRVSAPTLREGATLATAREHEPTRFDGGATPALTSDSAEQTLGETPWDRRDLVLSELLARLVGNDAPAAARIAELEDNGYMREAALRVVAQNWTRRDPIAAINWAASLGDQEERDAALANAALELAISQPQLALQALGRRSAPPSPDSTLAGVVQQWASNNFTTAYAWVDAQPSGPDRDALLARLVFARAEQHPADAARIANIAFSADASRLDAIASIAVRWGAQDPMAVREWALTLDTEAQRRVWTELAALGQ